MYGGAPVQTPRQQANYRRRQQAGIDALLAMATPVYPSEDQRADSSGEEPGGNGKEPLITNRNVKGP
jgi:hypothetical protein